MPTMVPTQGTSWLINKWTTGSQARTLGQSSSFLSLPSASLPPHNVTLLPSCQEPSPKLKFSCPIAPHMPCLLWPLPSFSPFKPDSPVSCYYWTLHQVTNQLRDKRHEALTALVSHFTEKLRQSLYNCLGRTSWVWLISRDIQRGVQ